jgi:hypothetical protein
MSNDMIVLHPDAQGHFDLPIARGDIDRIDIADVDLVITSKAGVHYLMPGAGLTAMSDTPPEVVFTNGHLSAGDLLGEVGAVLDLASAIPTPSSMKLEGADSGCGDGGKGGAGGNAGGGNAGGGGGHGDSTGCEVKHDQQQQHSQADQSQVSTLTVNTEASVEQLVQNAQQIDDSLHNHDYDYTPPQQFAPPTTAVGAPPGVTPPINLTPIVNLYMGNVVGTTDSTTDNPGYTTYYGGGGAVGSDPTSQIGPRDALQFSAATITGDNGNDIIYAEGPLVGNTDPAVSNSAYYAKAFIINVAGYFTELNDITFSGVPTGVSIVGATNEGNGTWVLPSSYALSSTVFTMVYSTAVSPGIFNVGVTISGTVSRGATFTSTQNFQFEYMDVTNSSQVTDPTLVYDDHGLSREIYVLPLLGQPNIITAGDGNDIVYGSLSNDTITLGNGNDQVTDGSGTDVITLGTGNNTITIGTGSDTITTGNGANTLTINGGTAGTDAITLGTDNTDTAANTIYVNSASGSTGTYNIELYGTGTQTIAPQATYAGDGNYDITMNGTGALDVTVGAGADTITTYGNSGTITAGTSSDTNAHTVYVDSTSGNTGLYTITLNGTGTQTVAMQNGYAGDGDFDITMSGTGVHNVDIGNSTSLDNGTTTFDTTITAGAGTNTITTGSGVHSINVGAGTATITTGAGNNTITTAGGGGTISTAQGNQVIDVNSTSGSTDAYSITTTGTGNTTLTGGDDNYTITAASGTNHITIGNASTSSSITATGAGVDTIATGTGNMTINAGSANGDTVNTGLGVDTITMGNGNNDVVTTHGGGTVTIGNGNTDHVTITTGAYTINDGNGSGDVISAGVGFSYSDIVNLGSGGSDSVTLGSGQNTVNIGLGTGNTIALGGSNNSVVNFSSITTTALTITFGTTGTSTATGTGVSDSITGVAYDILYGTNQGDTITLNTGNATVYAGSGNDTITLGTFTDIVYAGNGNNTIVGTNLTSGPSDHLFGGTGNNSFTNPDDSTSYYGTGSTGAPLAAMANNVAYTFTNTSATDPFANATTIPADVQHSYSGGVATIRLDLQTQINEINYSGSGATVNLLTGQGTGGTAAGSVYEFTSTGNGYGSINEIIGNGSGTFTPSDSSTVLVNTAFYIDGSTIAGETVILVGGTSGYRQFQMGAASEIVVAMNNPNDNAIQYQNSPSGVVVNLDDVSHTFSNTLNTTPITVAAYSGSNFGADQAGSSTSWSTGDYYVPTLGTGIPNLTLTGANNYINLVYGGTAFMDYIEGYVGGYFYAGSGGSLFQIDSASAAVVAVLTPGGVNIIDTSVNNSSYSMYVILNETLDTGSQSSKDSGVSLSYGGVTYTGFAYGWNNVTTPVGNPLHYISGYEDILGGPGNDYVVGDNNGNQVNAEAGNNTIILGDGTNIVTAIQGSNSITSSSADISIGVNTLNFETTNDSYSGFLGSYSGSTANTQVEAFLNYSGSSTESTFFGAGGDAAAFMGSTYASLYEVRTGTSSYSYSTVEAGIIATINGSDYSSGAVNSAIAVTSPSSSTNATFVYDNVDSGAATIIGHAGADIFIDNIGTAAETFNGSADTSNVYYASPTQIPDVTITGSSSHLNSLRVEGWGDTTLGTSGNAFGATDPFSTTKITGITEIDVRSGTDTVNTSTNTITLGPNSTTNNLSSPPVFNLSAADIQNLLGTSSTPTLILKLDNGETFTPTGTLSEVVSGGTTSYYNSATVHNSTTLIATDTHNTALYYSDVMVYNATNNAHLQIHYGSG